MRGFDPERRRALKQVGQAAFGAGLLGAVGKRYTDGRAAMADRTEGTYEGANRGVLDTMAAGEPVRVGIHYLDFGEEYGVPGRERPDYDWDEVESDVERIVGELPHTTVEAEAEVIDVPAAVEEQGYGEEKLRETHNATAVMPAMAPQSPHMVARFHEGTAWLDMDDEDDTVSTYMTGLASPVATGVALPKYGETFIDSQEVSDTAEMSKGVAHETVHHFGPRDDYVLFLSSGNGLMGSGDDIHVKQQTRDEVDRIYESYVNDDPDGGRLPS